MSNKGYFTEVSLESLMRLVRILGPSCAAADAIREMEKRKRNGENPHCYSTGGSLVVGPSLTPEAAHD